MAGTTKPWAIALIVIGALSAATGLAADRDASVVVGILILGFGLFALVRRRDAD